MRLIDADAIFKDELILVVPQEHYPIAKYIVEKIKNTPTVDAEPVKHGRWTIHFDDIWPEESTMECSFCHEEQGMGMLDTNFCPNCGAKMDEDEWQEPEINPCSGCGDYDGRGGCKSNGGCGAKMDEEVNEDGTLN